LKSQSRLEDCAHVLGRVAALREEMSSPIPPRDRAEYDAALEAARNALGEEMLSRISKDGWTSSLRQLDEVMREVGVSLPES